MMDCLLANTSARNPEIGVKAPLSRVLCHARGDLIYAAQSRRSENSTDAAGTDSFTHCLPIAGQVAVQQLWHRCAVFLYQRQRGRCGNDMAR